MYKKLICIVAVVLLVAVSAPLVMAAGKGAAAKQAIENAPNAQEALAQARANRRALPVGTERPARAAEAFGTIIYDNGVANVLPTVSSHMYGNRFDTALTTGGTMVGPVQATGSVTMVSFYMVSVSAPNVFVSIADQLNTGAGTAMNIISNTYPAVTGFNTATLSPAVNYVGSSFLAGVWYFGADVPGLGTATVNGQGIHGVHINDNPSTLNSYTPSTTFNAIFGATGNLLTPVELMSFSISDQ